MSITMSRTPPPTAADRIYTHRLERPPDMAALRERVERLARDGRITGRDERLLELLREMNVLSLDQARRLFWPAAREKTAYRRLLALLKWQLLAGARTPRAGMREWGLPVRKVYALGPAGRLWLRAEVDDRPPRHLKRSHVLHDLLVAELFVDLTEAALRRGPGWSVSWAGERAASFYEKRNEPGPPVIAPDGLGVVRQQRGDETAELPFFVELDAGREGHGRPSSDWGRKVIGYDRFYSADWKRHPELGRLGRFPPVAVVTHGPQRLLNLLEAIQNHRRQPVAYALSLWSDLRAHDDALVAPVWAFLTPDGQLVGQTPDKRQPLLAVAG